MIHPSLRSPACLIVVCTISTACSFQVPDEDKVFSSGAGAQGTGGITGSAGSTATLMGGASANVGGYSASGGELGVGGLAGGSTTTGTAGDGAGGNSNNGGSAGAATTIPNTATGGVAGNVGFGGTPSSGGTSSAVTGGSVASGGTSEMLATGGTGTVAGATASGGASVAGGASSTGGTQTVIGSSGGAGNSENTGGEANSGGSPSTGGFTGTGVPTGGTESTGGTVSTGGVPATGGTADTGGVNATGGTGPAPKAILEYKFEDLAGTTATDSTSNHYDGSLTSVAWSASGRNGGGVNYSATDSSIAMPSGVLGDAHALTISSWVYLTTNSAENRLFYFGAGTDTYLTFALNDSSGGMSLRFQGASGTEKVLTTPTLLPLGFWKHVAVTVSTYGCSIYIDGKVVAQNGAIAVDPSLLGAGTTNLVGTSPTVGQSFHGLLDEFYIYDGVLPLSEIRQLAWPKSDYSMYHFEEGTGASTVDSSDRAINGTLMGGATWVTGPIGKGVNLSNTTIAPAQQFVDLADGIVANCATNLTLAGWFNLTTNSTDAPFLELAQDTTHFVNITTYTTPYSQPVISFGFVYGTQNRTVRQRPYDYWNNGIWTHVAAVRNGTSQTASLYRDGKLVVSGPLATATTLSSWGNTTLNAIGKSANDTIPGFNGSVDEVLISCRNYTDDEIKQLAYLPQ